MSADRAVDVTTMGDELPFDWAALVPLVVHPMRVVIIEAMLWTGRPVTATDVSEMFDQKPSVSFVAYHIRVLASPKVSVIRQVRKRQVRGAEEKYFYLRDAPPPA